MNFGGATTLIGIGRHEILCASGKCEFTRSLMGRTTSIAVTCLITIDAAAIPLADTIVATDKPTESGHVLAGKEMLLVQDKPTDYFLMLLNSVLLTRQGLSVKKQPSDETADVGVFNQSRWDEAVYE